MENEMTFSMKPIGFVYTDATEIPRHWSISNIEGRIVIDSAYMAGLSDIQRGKRIIVIFCFHKSPAFEPGLLKQTPPHRDRPLGVFSICSPRRPNKQQPIMMIKYNLRQVVIVIVLSIHPLLGQSCLFSICGFISRTGV